MSFIFEEELDSISIERFIFHIVQKNEDDPILLEETPIGEFEEFFLERIKDTMKGNKFEFVEDSNTHRLLKEIHNSPDCFISNSKKLARDFHANRSRSIKPGVFFVIELLSESRKLYSLIKYDHEQVLTYNVEKDSKAVLMEISNSFTKSKDSLHKSALISVDENGGDLIVIDRTVSYDITKFFRAFLNVKRKYSEKEMTSVVNEAIIDTVRKHRDELPREVTSKIRTDSFTTIENTEIFDSEQFFNKVLGSHGNEKIKKTFDKILKDKHLEGESFKFDSKGLKKPKERKLKTKEGVKIHYGESAEDTVNIKYGKESEPTIITIKTIKLTEE